MAHRPHVEERLVWRHVLGEGADRPPPIRVLHLARPVRRTTPSGEERRAPRGSSGRPFRPGPRRRSVSCRRARPGYARASRIPADRPRAEPRRRPRKPPPRLHPHGLELRGNRHPVRPPDGAVDPAQHLAIAQAYPAQLPAIEGRRERTRAQGEPAAFHGVAQDDLRGASQADKSFFTRPPRRASRRRSSPASKRPSIVREPR